MSGTNGNDNVSLSNSANAYDGRSGNDTIRGNRGNDTLLGGDGNDSIRGDDDNDSLLGGAGDDVLRGGADNDVLRGADGDDRLYGDDGNDTLEGDDGQDSIFGGTGADLVIGGAGNDSIAGGDGADLIRGDTLVLDPWAFASAGGAETTIEMNNTSTQTVEVHFIDGSGTPVLYATLAPGQSFSAATYTEHNWALKDVATGEWVAVYLGDVAQTQTFTGAGNDTVTVNGGEVAVHIKDNQPVFEVTPAAPKAGKPKKPKKKVKTD